MLPDYMKLPHNELPESRHLCIQLEPIHKHAIL